MDIRIDPDAREFILKKGHGAFVLDMAIAQGWCGSVEQPMVSLGKPKDKSYQFVPVEVDGLTMYKNTNFGDDLHFNVALTKFMFSKMLRLDPISKLPPLEE